MARRARDGQRAPMTRADASRPTGWLAGWSRAAHNHLVARPDAKWRRRLCSLSLSLPRWPGSVCQRAEAGKVGAKTKRRPGVSLAVSVARLGSAQSGWLAGWRSLGPMKRARPSWAPMAVRADAQCARESEERAGAEEKLASSQQPAAAAARTVSSRGALGPQPAKHTRAHARTRLDKEFENRKCAYISDVNVSLTHFNSFERRRRRHKQRQRQQQRRPRQVACGRPSSARLAGLA